ncbi:hypothetical protein [Modestobacter sp. VKM Ac-2984]|uniref:hypothetical protein n=1 Tax=Modestobacter sp. VKM Ac-2984 TaxID=3004138 RepID=UPI0022AAD1C9|nr:hypothetical protein [Modestobacter sp. VKM Ac-2984]MCZ2817873.1 hypothetical protein [Modestobacter sp. VKM Ac-2984]
MPTINTTNRTRLLAVPAALALAMTAAACGDDETVVEEAEEAPGIQLVEGEQVTIEGEVQEVLDPYAFTVGEDETLVYGAEAFTVEEGDEVTVTGDVAVFTIADVEEEYDFDLTDDLYVDYETELAVESDEVVATTD